MGARARSDVDENGHRGVDADSALRTRRRILLGGAGAAPVIMSLSSPALASTNCGAGNVASPSAATSANLSGRPHSTTSTGVSPGYWKNHLSWPSGYFPTTANGQTATTFVSVFGSNLPSWTKVVANACPTLLDVISPNQYGSASSAGGAYVNGVNNSDPKTAFARACVASLLNSAAGKYVDSSTGGTWLTQQTIKDMWAAGLGSGWTVPGTIPPVIWNYTQIQTYLVRIWDASSGCTC